MGVDVYTEKERKAYKDTFTKKWALENYSKEGSHTETVIYTPEYSEKIFDQYRATFLQQDHQIHEQLQATPLLPELAHEVIEFAMGKGPCSRSNQCPTPFYQKATNPQPESKPKPGPTSHHCALL
ncbi:hypothetical protein Psal073_03311 (plasmid) [Piscirickettsia salmonis]|uniref:hypothetical protein n=1 Tax=Piscirickettsia salmonis TaxID=1238 RepID=UPI001E5A2A28|nr:hypothetical protein [Piscirickettsia salmonis]QGO68307.1 hypothetical protein Psal073_03311 [Piscirickettsia salmonis]